MPHVQKNHIFPHMRLHFSAFSLFNVHLRPLDIFLAAYLRQYFQLDIKEIENDQESQK